MPSCSLFVRAGVADGDGAWWNRYHSTMAVEYVLPVGLHLDDPSVDIQEGYEAHWRQEEDPPHYLLYAQVSALRLERLLREAIGCLPSRVRAVLEVRRADAELDRDPDGPEHDRWVSDTVPRAEVLRIIDRYGYSLLHDGMVGFGAYDPDSPLEIFLDDHKLLSLFSPTMDPFEALLIQARVPHLERVGTMFDEPHDHYTLPSVPEKFVPRGGLHLRRRRLDIVWFAQAIRTRLGMRPEPQPVDGR